MIIKSKTYLDSPELMIYRQPIRHRHILVMLNLNTKNPVSIQIKAMCTRLVCLLIIDSEI